MLRNVGFAILAIVVFQVFTIAGDMSSFSFFTLPDGMDPMSMDSVREHMHLIPLGAFFVMMAGHILGSFSAGWIVGRATANVTTAWVVGALITAGGVANLAMVPHPTWFWVDALIYPVFVYLGFRMGCRR